MRVWIPLALLTALSASAARAESRTIEELIVISPVVVTGKVMKEDGEQKIEDETYKKHSVLIAAALRAPESGPKAKETITAFSPESLKKDAEHVFFLGPKTQGGYILRATQEPKQADTVGKMLEFEARAKAEMKGKAKLLAAFYRAHQLRPVLFAGEQGKALKQAGAIDAKEADALLAILGEAFQNAWKKNANAHQQRLATKLQEVLTGNGGLPVLRTRQETAVRFWAVRLNNRKLREGYELAKLTVTDKPAQQVVQRPVILPMPQPSPPLPPPPKPKPLAWPNPGKLGAVVNGLSLKISTEKQSYNLVKDNEQKVVIAATFENKSSKPMRLNTYLLLDLLASIQVQEPNGRLRRHENNEIISAPELPAMGPWSFKKLKPGETLTVRRELSPYLFPRHGRYRVVVAYNNSYGKRFGIRDAWSGDVWSQALPIDIVRYEEEKPPPKPKPQKPTDPKPTPPRKPGADPKLQREQPQAQQQIPLRNAIIQQGGRIQVQVIGGGPVIIEAQVPVQPKTDPKKPAPKPEPKQ
jgi:hypothetical protein